MIETNWRVFCAIEVSGDVRQQVSNHIGALRQGHDQVHASWVIHTNLHLTIRFIGNIALRKVDTLRAAAARAVNGLVRFPIVFEGTGVFPGLNSPRVLWIGVNDASAGLAQLYARLEKECTGSGFAQDDRSFTPHLTLARVREPSQARALAEDHLRSEFLPIEMLVSELLVIRSQMSSKGSTYTVMSRHPLI